MTRSMTAAALAVTVVLAGATGADAKGCIKGAVIGAAVGCAIGHHEAVKKERAEKAAAARNAQTQHAH